MSLSLKAKATIAVGVLIALIFLVLGIQELRRASAPQSPPPATARPNTQNAKPATILAAAARPIETGQTITADMIRNIGGDPARYPAIATPAEVVGKVATRPVAAGAMIERSAVDVATKLAIRVPVGMRAISIDTTAEIAVAGLVRPGDRVDVQVVYPGADALSGVRREGSSRSRTLLQMVQVLAVGDVVVGTKAASGAEGQMSSPPPPARTVTLALNPDQVQLLSLAKTTGSLYLSLRNPEDSEQVEVETAVSDGPARSAPQAAAAPARAPATRAPSRSHAIELVVGGRRDVIYSGEAQR